MNSQAKGTRWLIAMTFLLFSGGCCQRRVDPIDATRLNLGLVGCAITTYAEYHNGALPQDFGVLTDPQKVGRFFLKKEALVVPRIPVIPGAHPPTSFHYVPCGADAPPATIILFPNCRGPGGWPYVYRKNGKGDVLTREQYEKELRALGVDYDALPVLAAQDMRWDLVSWHVVGVCLGVAALLALGAWLLFRRRRDLV